MKYEIKKYGEFIPLGHNCELSAWWVWKQKFIHSSLFNWVGVYKISDLTFAINNLDKLLAEEIYYPNPLYECSITHIRFHGELDMSQFLKGGVNEELYRKDLESLKGRTKYLKQKFISIVQSEQRKLFAYKMSPFDAGNIRQFVSVEIDCLYDALVKIESKNFDLLIICEDKYLPFFPENHPRYFLRSVGKFNPLDHAVDTDTEESIRWDAIFDEFQPVVRDKLKHKFKYQMKHHAQKSSFTKLMLAGFRTIKRLLSTPRNPYEED